MAETGYNRVHPTQINRRRSDHRESPPGLTHQKRGVFALVGSDGSLTGSYRTHRKQLDLSGSCQVLQCNIERFRGSV
jgi:hypothetical protein